MDVRHQKYQHKNTEDWGKRTLQKKRGYLSPKKSNSAAVDTFWAARDRDTCQSASKGCM